MYCIKTLVLAFLLFWG